MWHLQHSCVFKWFKPQPFASVMEKGMNPALQQRTPPHKKPWSSIHQTSRGCHGATLAEVRLTSRWERRRSLPSQQQKQTQRKIAPTATATATLCVCVCVCSIGFHSWVPLGTTRVALVIPWCFSIDFFTCLYVALATCMCVQMVHIAAICARHRKRNETTPPQKKIGRRFIKRLGGATGPVWLKSGWLWGGRDGGPYHRGLSGLRDSTSKAALTATATRKLCVCVCSLGFHFWIPLGTTRVALVIPWSFSVDFTHSYMWHSQHSCVFKGFKSQPLAPVRNLVVDSSNVSGVPRGHSCWNQVDLEVWRTAVPTLAAYQDYATTALRECHVIGLALLGRLRGRRSLLPRLAGSTHWVQIFRKCLGARLASVKLTPWCEGFMSLLLQDVVLSHSTVDRGCRSSTRCCSTICETGWCATFCRRTLAWFSTHLVIRADSFLGDYLLPFVFFRPFVPFSFLFFWVIL